MESLPMLERAAEVMLGNPHLVTAEERRSAENVFQEMKRELRLEDVPVIIQNTSNQFILFQLGQAVGELILREWAILDGDQIERIYKYLIEYVAGTQSLQNYVIEEFVKSVAMIRKRGILDKKSGNDEQLYQLIEDLLVKSDSARLQTIGCQLISSVTEQFSSSWRNAKFSITWDFHLKAKAEFEMTGLRRLLEMALKTLHTLCTQADILNNAFAKRLCDKFLEVAENIFSWNFSARLRPFKRIFAIAQATNGFRPPGSWKDLVHNLELYSLFFQLHDRIRANESLALRSLSCLTQLAGLSGECMTVNGDEEDGGFAQQFVQMFVTNFMNLFSAGPQPHEINGFCTVLNRLFVLRPVQTLIRLPTELRTQFFTFLSTYIQHLTVPAMTKAIGENEHGEQASLVLLYDSWCLLLRGRWRTRMPLEEQELIDAQLSTSTTEMVNSFIRAVQAGPFGTRPVACDDEDDEDDDRVLFQDLFSPLGTMTSYNVGVFMKSMTMLLRERIGELQGMLTGQVADARTRLPLWQEDMHWLMLTLAHSVVVEDADGSCSLVQEVYDYSHQICTKANQIFNEDVKQEFLTQCINSPTTERTEQMDQMVDPFMSLFGELFVWASMEHNMLIDENLRGYLSPEVSRSTLLCLKRFINAASRIPDVDLGVDVMAMPVIHNYGPFNETVVTFSLNKVFSILQHLTGEERLCTDSVDMLTGLIESRASVLAAAPQLFNVLAMVDIAKLPSRTALMKALVLIAAAAHDEALQANMFHNILVPLRNRFDVLCQQPSTTEGDSQLVDLLQCFDGVAQASEHTSAPTLAKFLHPLLSQCVPLMKSRAHAPAIVTALLQLLLDVTTRVSIYVEDQEDLNLLNQTLLQTVDVYRTEQKERFMRMASRTTTNSDDDDKSADLAIFIDILSNVLSKDLLDNGDGTVATGAQVTMMALEMLLSIMNETMLETPDLSLKFYRLIVYLVQFSPDALASMSGDLQLNICQCIRTGMTCRFGLEVCSLSLEALSEIANYLCTHRELQSDILNQNMRQFIVPAFEACLEYSCENSVFNEAASSLYSLICFDKATFDEFVSSLLTQKSNAAAAHHLQAAFTILLPATVEANRRDRISFRRRMETFLSEIQGLLTMN